jgi:type IX secretion system PorP/SprF family membrane protein
MKKTLILIAFVAFGVGQVLAQQVPLYSHYYYNKFLYNPSLAGAEDYGQLYLINRDQWNQIPGAPRTQAVTVDGPLNSDKVGVGLGVYRDVAGQFNITGAQAAYRYSIDFGGESRLNFGLGLGVLNSRIDLSELEVKHVTDPTLLSSYQAATGFDANFGISYNFKNLLIGVTVPQIIGNELAYSSLTNPNTGKDVRYGLAQHFIAHASYELDVFDNEKWFWQPNAMLRVTPGTRSQFDISSVVSYMRKYWGGAMYRSNYAVTLSAGMRLVNQFVLGYAYDIAVHKDLNQYTRGAHEVMIGYQWGHDRVDGGKIKDDLAAINERLNRNDIRDSIQDDEIKTLKDDVDDLDKEVKSNDDDIDDIRKQLKTFDDFMTTYKKKEKAKIGDIFTFNNVYFETNKWEIRPGSTAELNNLISILKENPSLKIEVAGHADPRGTDSYNLWLSNKRSNAVRDYLIRNGVSPSQLEVKGYGEKEPTGTSLDKDRRVEFKILAQ